MTRVFNESRSRSPVPAVWVWLGLSFFAWAAVSAQSPAPSDPSAESPPPASAPATGPRIEVAQTEVDLGQLVIGETAEARFELRNTGTETLRILRAKPG